MPDWFTLSLCLWASLDGFCLPDEDPGVRVQPMPLGIECLQGIDFFRFPFIIGSSLEPRVLRAGNEKEKSTDSDITKYGELYLPKR